MAIKAQEKREADAFLKENEEIISILNSTWQAIGGDILDAVGQEKALRKKSVVRDSREPSIDYSVTMPRSHVIEVVLDAGHLESHGGGGGGMGSTHSEVVKRFRALTYDQKKYIARQAFPYSTYGY